MVIPHNGQHSGAEEVGTKVLKCNFPFWAFTLLSQIDPSKKKKLSSRVFIYPADIN